MGEAIYHLRARFADSKTAQRVGAEFRKLVAEGRLAYDWWQDHRRGNDAEFWVKFRKGFPLTTGYLEPVTVIDYPAKAAAKFKGETPRCAVLDGDCGNALAGLLDFGADDSESGEWPEVDGSVLTWSAEVWHWATWKWVVAWLVAHGATAADYLSDEHADIADRAALAAV